MKIAVTAVSGQLGRAVLNAVAIKIGKENCIGLCRNPDKTVIEGIEVRKGDYGQPEQFEASLQGVDALLLVSGNDAPDKRIAQHRNVIQAAKAAGVEKIVYTSVQGADEGTSFSPVIQSNRQTEADLRSSGLAWAIGRNGIYIEPDVEYIDTYIKAGEIANCAGNGKCGYTTRHELAAAYANLLVDASLNGGIYNLHGEALTQRELVSYLNQTFNTKLTYRSMSVADYQEDRTAELGAFIGTIITGIYQGILEGKSNNSSDFEKTAGRPHQLWQDYFATIKATHVVVK